MFFGISIPCSLLVLVLLPNLQEDFCSCRYLGEIDHKQYAEYQIIFEGKVIEIVEGEFIRKISLEIKEIYKGSHSKDRIEIYSNSPESACGLSPWKGEDWLIFAYRLDKGYKTTICTRSKLINSPLKKEMPDLTKEIEFLKKARETERKFKY